MAFISGRKQQQHKLKRGIHYEILYNNKGKIQTGH